MSVSLSDLRSTLQRRLCDEGERLWSKAELDIYISTGYDTLARLTGCLFDSACIPDYAFAFNFTSEFERDFVESVPGWYCDGPAQFTTELERDYVNNAAGPANHNEHWEFNGGYQSITEVSALAERPDGISAVERATWNTKRLEAVHSRDLEGADSRYELNKGEVQAFVQDKDGIDVLRKWRVPSVGYVPYSFDASSDDGFGIIRDLDGIHTGIAVDGSWGDLVQVDGENVFEDFGILGPIYKETNDLRLEYRRYGKNLADDQGFEIADRYTIYVRHFAQARALEKEGPTQDLKLAAHFQSRFEVGVARMKKRATAMLFQQLIVMGGAPSIRGQRPARARFPYAYGRVVR